MTVSVVIPTLNESACLPRTLEGVRAQGPHEVLVVDGGSTDGTRELARAADRVLSAPAGRAAQMNAGAAEATGEVLLFLHADCVLEEGALDAARHCLGRPGVAAGCFRLRVSAPGLGFRLIDAAATARVRLTGLVYGDQGLFVPRRLFLRLGGFPPVRLFEDVLISRRLRRHGRVVVAPKRVFVSPRRWQKEGLVRQTLRNWALTALVAVGLPADGLARFYPPVR